jgi:hypothetical protein
MPSNPFVGVTVRFRELVEAREVLAHSMPRIAVSALKVPPIEVLRKIILVPFVKWLPVQPSLNTFSVVSNSAFAGPLCLPFGYIL